MKKDISHDEAMASIFKEDPEYSAAYVQQLLKDGEPFELETAIRQLDCEAKIALEERLKKLLNTRM